MVAPIRPDTRPPGERRSLGQVALPDEAAREMERLVREELTTDPAKYPDRIERIREERRAILARHHPDLDQVLDRHREEAAAQSARVAAGQEPPIPPP